VSQAGGSGSRLAGLLEMVVTTTGARAPDAATVEPAPVLDTAETAVTAELPRATIMFCDMIGSTEMSVRLHAETYRGIVRRFKGTCRRIIEERYGGYVVHVKGDGMLALFGVPSAHGDDAERAVRTGLDIVDAVRDLSRTVVLECGETVGVRVGVHRGLVYFDTDDDDIYGMTVNLASRLEGLAPPDSIVISEEVRRHVERLFLTVPQPPQQVKGFDEPLVSHRVTGINPVGIRRRLDLARMVGRADEMARLQALWDEVRAGTGSAPRALMVRGDAGIGKSHLAAAFTADALDGGCTVVQLNGSPFHVEVGLHPLRMLLEDRCGMRDASDAPDRLRRLRDELDRVGLDPEGLLPLLAPVVGLGPEAGYRPAASDARKLAQEISEAACAFLVASCGSDGTVLVAEDTHWFDESTLTVIAGFVHVGPSRAMVLATSRPEGPPLPGAEELDLAPLSAPECDALIGQLTKVALPEGQRAELARRSDGVPLYLEELVASLAHLTELHQSDVPIGPDNVPDHLYDLLLARLHGSEQDTAVAAAAAAIGRTVHRDLLAAVAGLDRTALDEALDSLVSHRVLDPVDDGRATLRFRHELLREVAYELMPPTRRQQAHGRVADALVAAGDAGGVTDWPVVATHFELAGRFEASVRALSEAAEAARQRGDLLEAGTQLARGIDLVGDHLPGPSHITLEVDLRLRHGYLMTATEGSASPRAAHDFERCLELVTAPGSREDSFRTLIVLWGYYTIRAELGQARRILESLRDQLHGGREYYTPFNRAGFAMLDWYEGRFDQAQSVLEEVAGQEARIGHDDDLRSTWFMPNDPRVAVHTHLALALVVTGDPGGAEMEFRRAEERANEVDFPAGPFSLAYSLVYEAWALTELRHLDRAREVLQRLIDLSTERGFDNWLMVAFSEQAAVAGVEALEDPASGSETLALHADILDSVVAAWRAADTLVFVPFYLTLAGTLAGAAGDAGRARQRLADSLSLSEQTALGFYDAEIRRQLGRVAQDPETLDDWQTDALHLARAQGALLFELRAALDRFDRAGPAARSDLERAVARFAPGSSFGELEQARSLLAGG
jgi:class 3 adenylate cyclase/tetratricopeptide (TPR) repeat protein